MRDLVSEWSEKITSWFVCFTDSELFGCFLANYTDNEITAFAPLACVQTGMNVRLAGDGPSNWTTWLAVARTKKAHK